MIKKKNNDSLSFFEKATTIAILNQSTTLSFDEIDASIPDFQAAVNEDFGPFWGRTGKLVLVPKDQKPPPGSWWIEFVEESDQPAALGYHYITKEGMPTAKIFAKKIREFGVNWQVSLTHQLFEMLADPWISLFVATNNMKIFYPVQVANAVQGDQLAYKKGNTMISDFVLPTWFEEYWEEGEVQFDFRYHLNAPLSVAKGGYISLWTPEDGWKIETEVSKDRLKKPWRQWE